MLLQKPNKSSRKSVRKELIAFVAACIFSVALLLSAASIYFTYNSTEQALIKSMKETSELASEKVSRQIETYSMVAESTRLYQRSINDEKTAMKTYLQTIASKNDLTSIDILDSKGVSTVDGADRSKDPAFVGVRGSKSFLTDPIIDQNTAYFEYAHPYDGSVIVMKFPYSVLGLIINNIKMGATGSTYILNNKGAKVAHSDFDNVLKQQNNLVAVKTNPQIYGEVAKLETEMIQGKTGFGFYSWKGQEKFGSFTPIAQTNGWSINVTALKSEFMSQVTTSVVCIVILGILSMIISLLIAVRIANRITKPIDGVVTAIEKLSGGDLEISLTVQRDDEIGLMSEKINDMVKGFRSIISDISRFLNEIARGNLTVQSECEYVGEFARIHTSMETILSSLNQTITQIRLAAEQVSSGSNQMSDGAQALSQGATEQASAIEELSATISDVSNQLKDNASDSEAASVKVSELHSEMKQSTEQMQNMIASMQQINDTSNQIGKIIKTIDDIAFQTNILALNAAVEAARAGSAGKGFAVVAEEVRNLASKSAEAVKVTTTLITSSMKAVEDGAEIADRTAKSLTKASEKTDDVTSLVVRISDATNKQSNSIAQITQGVDQVASVVQTNSATAEESAASSEELSGQAEMLRSLVSEFRLMETAPTEKPAESTEPEV